MPSDLTRARLQVVAAGVLWSLSGFFTKALTKPTALALDEPPIHPLTITEYRALFAGLALLPLLHASSRPAFDGRLLGMTICFVAMSILFVSALAGGPAATAILLQYTAPLWVMIAGAALLGERFHRDDVWLLIGGLTGVAVLIVGNWQASDPKIIAAGLGSGLFYAGVLLFLRLQRDRSPMWLTAVNLLGTAAIVAPLVLFQPIPRPMQLAWLAAFGLVQLAIPYFLMATALRHVSSFEAGLLTLIEPVLNPLWAYLVSPATERPNAATLIGGAIILSALAIRYWPRTSIKNER